MTLPFAPLPPPTPLQQLGMFVIGMGVGRVLIHFAVKHDEAVAARSKKKVSWTARLS